MIPDLDRLAELAWVQLWQVTLVAIVVGLLVMLLGRRRSHLAHALWLLVILKCLTPPVWSSPTGVFSWATSGPASPVAATASSPGIAAPVIATPNELPEASSVMSSSRVAEDEQATSVSDATVFSPEQPAMGPVAWLSLLWILGTAVYLMVTLAAGLAWLWRLKASHVGVDPPLALAIVDLSRRLHVRRNVRLRITSEPIGPAVYGVLRPTLVLPAAILPEKTGGSLEPILAHELIHARRGDGLVCLLQWLAQAVWWFHPLVWWTNRRLSQERERCCDEEVLAGLRCEPADYAKSLLDLLKLKHALRPRLAFPGARPVEVTMKRLENIMDTTRRFSARTPRSCWFVLAVGLFVALPGAAIKNDGLPVVPKTPREEAAHGSATPAPSNKETPKTRSTPSKPRAKPPRRNRSVVKYDLGPPSDPTLQPPQPARDPNDLLALPAGFAAATGPIQPFDVLYIRALGTLLDQQIHGYYLVDAEGQVSLGPAYGRVDLKGATVDEANRRCEKQLQVVLTKPFIKVKRIGRVTRWHKAIVPEGPYRIKVGDILFIHAMGTLLDLPIQSYYLVEPTGSVDLFVYGDPVIQGQAFEEAEKTITKALKRTLTRPETAVTMGHWKIVECPLPKGPYRIACGDLLQIRVLGTLLDQPVNGTYFVEPSGTVQLGPAYGRTKVLGLSLVEAETAVRKHLQVILARPEVSVTLAGWKELPKPTEQPQTPEQPAVGITAQP